jgi:predicted Zn-dependent peptidase
MNRSLPPTLVLTDHIDLIYPQAINLKNGMNAYLINSGEQDVVKLELVFKAGDWFAVQAVLASAVNDLLDSGTSNKSAFEIASSFDFYGAYLQTECTHDVASIKLFTLTRFLKPTITLLLEILQDAAFPQSEVAIFADQHIQQLQINRQKVEYLARKEFLQALFPGSPYGRYAEEQDYKKLTSETLKTWFLQNYQSGNGFVILSGKLPEDVVQLLNDTLGEWSNIQSYSVNGNKESTPPFSGIRYIEKKGALQCAIRMGINMPNKLHDDFIPLTVLSTILGGYFGSRLMSNLREDKGYTYGVGSSMVSLLQGGYFFIATQVGKEVKDDALKQIEIEIKRLQQEPVDNNELDLVKNYMTGVFQRNMDGAMAISDRLKAALIYGQDMTIYQHYLQKVLAINSQQITDLAHRYLEVDQMATIIVG